MTVAIGLVCKDGVLVASDSMGSDQMTATKTRKVRQFERAPIIWTASGSVYVMEEVMVELVRLDEGKAADGGPLSCFTSPILNALRSQLTTGVHKAMSKAYKSALTTEPLPAGTIHPNFITNLLMLGYSNDIPWFLEFSYDGQINWHTEAKFYATGSGGPFATVAAGLMRHYMSDELTLEDGKLLAYRTIDTTIEVSNTGVGPPVQIAICNSDGTHILTDEEIEEVRTGVDRWKTLESELLTTLKSGLENGASAVNDLPIMKA